MKNIIIPILCLMVLASCSKKEYNALLKTSADMEADYKKQLELKEQELENEKKRASELAEQLDFLKSNNTNLLDRLADLSVVNIEGAESIKKSLHAINEQSKYIKDLNNAAQVKDSLNLALVMNLKRSLADVNDEDVNVEVKKGVVYISLSDKMLYRSGSSVVLPEAENVLGKIAKIINDKKDFDILVEGHTDTDPISNECVKDNWDLSVKRATAVVRVLQTKHNVDPARMTAGGRSEYVPKASNDTKEGKSANRRTEIIVLPKLDQFFELYEKDPPK